MKITRKQQEVINFAVGLTESAKQIHFMVAFRDKEGVKNHLKHIKNLIKTYEES